MTDPKDIVKAAIVVPVPVEPTLQLKPLSEVKRRRPVMLLPGWMIPVGTVCVLAGQQGIGKGTVISCISAHLSHSSGVIFLSEEDSAEATVKPRIEAVGGDVTRIYIAEAVRENTLSGVLLPRDTEELGKLAAGVGAKLIVVDPWTNHVDGMDVDKGTIRTALMPLKHLADEHDLVVMLSAHPVKNAGRGDPLSEIAHASAVTQVARSAYWVTLDPEHGSDQKTNPYRLCAQIKNNMTRRGDTLRYRLDEVWLPANGDEDEMEIVAAEFVGTSDLDYASIRKLEQSADHEPDPDTEIGRCSIWLRDYLAGSHQESGAVIAAGEAAGFHTSTIKRARERIGVVARRGSIGSPSVWSLPSAHPVSSHKNSELTELTEPTVEKSEENNIPTRASAPSAHSARTGSDDELTGDGPTVEVLVAQIDRARDEGLLPDLDDQSWVGLKESFEDDHSEGTVEALTAILGGAR